MLETCGQSEGTLGAARVKTPPILIQLATMLYPTKVPCQLFANL